MSQIVLRFAMLVGIFLSLHSAYAQKAAGSPAAEVVNVRVVAITDQASVGTGAGTTFSSPIREGRV